MGKVVFVVGLDGGFKRTDLIERPAVGFVVSVVVGGFDACRPMRIEVVTRVGLRGKQSCVHVACDDAAAFGSRAALSVCAVKNNQVFDFVRHKRAAYVPARACQRVHIVVVVVVAAVSGELDAVVFFGFQQWIACDGSSWGLIHQRAVHAVLHDGGKRVEAFGVVADAFQMREGNAVFLRFRRCEIVFEFARQSMTAHFAVEVVAVMGFPDLLCRGEEETGFS